MTAPRRARRAVGALVAAGTLACAASCGGSSATDADRRTPATSTAPDDPSALAGVFADAHAFVRSEAGRRTLAAEEELTASCMAEAGFEYRAVAAPPGEPEDAATTYGLVDSFVDGGQDLENAAIESGLDPATALRWREALNGPPRSAGEDVPISDDPRTAGCAGAALPQLLGADHATDLSELVGRAEEIALDARADPAVVSAQSEHDRCLLASGVSVEPDDVAGGGGFAAYPVVRRWADELDLPPPAEIRSRLAAGDDDLAAALDGLRRREAALLDADRSCDAGADLHERFDAAMRRRSASDPTPTARRHAFLVALRAATAVEGD